MTWTQLSLPLATADEGADGGRACEPAPSPWRTFECCPLCGGELRPEHAHYRCGCGWRDSCCD